MMKVEIKFVDSPSNIDDNSYYAYDQFYCGDLDDDGYDNDCLEVLDIVQVRQDLQ